MKRSLKTMLSIILILAMVLSIAGCGSRKAEAPETQKGSEVAAETDKAEETQPGSETAAESEKQTELVTATTDPLPRHTFISAAVPGEQISAAVPAYTIDGGLANVENKDQFYLDEEAIAKLEKYGFVIIESTGTEFFTPYEQNRYSYIPNFVTTDAMM
ncbi:MAG: DUF3160 domain-containing protein, partial [Lachnospiraceae bacterium]|nr:DUF3160 domain-containing protein [Lachnospiraceae bacterium]